MSDDLIKRLGKSVWTLDEAADRIEQLEREIDELSVLTGMVKDGLEAKLTKAVEALRECQEEIDQYIWHEYPLDHPVHDRYRKRDLSANPARIALAELEGGE